jgi:hypothetical protein
VGGVIVAVFDTVAGGVAVAMASMVYVSAPPIGNVEIVSFNAPLPEIAGQVARPEATHLHDWLTMPTGRGSLRMVFGASTEPLFITTTTKLTVPLGATDVVVVLFWIETIAPADRFVLLLQGGVEASAQTPPGGSDTVAVFVTVAGGIALTVALISYCTLPPAGKVARTWLIAPLPATFGQAAPPAAVQFHEKEVRPAGMASATAAFGTATVPLFVTVTV